MKGLQIMKRDLLLLQYLHRYKVATVKHIMRDIFHADDSTVWKRLQKLKRSGYIETLRLDSTGDRSTIIRLGKSGFNLLKKRNPNEYLILRSKSNSIDHDLKLLEIHRVFKVKPLVTNYWTENVLESSLQIAEDEKLSLFKMFHFDALLKLDNNQGSRVICGLEYEASLKTYGDYKKKFSQLYQFPHLKVILYICENHQIEKALKRCELEVSPEGDKKVYYIQSSEFFNQGENVTFKNQNDRFLKFR